MIFIELPLQYPQRKAIFYEVRYWTEALGVSRERLEELVRKHGNSAENIREALRKEAA